MNSSNARKKENCSIRLKLFNVIGACFLALGICEFSLAQEIECFDNSGNRGQTSLLTSTPAGLITDPCGSINLSNVSVLVERACNSNHRGSKCSFTIYTQEGVPGTSASTCSESERANIRNLVQKKMFFNLPLREPTKLTSTNTPDAEIESHSRGNEVINFIVYRSTKITNGNFEIICRIVGR